ncbi:MAG TPA: hypothetical protein VK017_01655 [Sphingobacterium sp.]|nr:hypothetical protein [Sphingobacterium sp.]
MRYIWDLVKHFWLSNSRHGTHSPFVYKLADQAIYRPYAVPDNAVAFPEQPPVRYVDMLRRILIVMGIARIERWTPGSGAPAIWCDLLTASAEELLLCVRRGSVVVVHEPMKSRAVRRKWQVLVSDPDVVVSINLFHFGVILHREGQRKEHFLLRYPYWQRNPDGRRRGN